MPHNLQPIIKTLKSYDGASNETIAEEENDSNFLGLKSQAVKMARKSIGFFLSKKDPSENEEEDDDDEEEE